MTDNGVRFGLIQKASHKITCPRSYPCVKFCENFLETFWLSHQQIYKQMGVRDIISPLSYL